MSNTLETLFGKNSMLNGFFGTDSIFSEFGKLIDQNCLSGIEETYEGNDKEEAELKELVAKRDELRKEMAKLDKAIEEKREFVKVHSDKPYILKFPFNSDTDTISYQTNGNRIDISIRRSYPNGNATYTNVSRVIPFEFNGANVRKDFSEEGYVKVILQKTEK